MTGRCRGKVGSDVLRGVGDFYVGSPEYDATRAQAKVRCILSEVDHGVIEREERFICVKGYWNER
jgi:hypothetical protein